MQVYKYAGKLIGIHTQYIPENTYIILCMHTLYFQGVCLHISAKFFEK